MKRIIFVLLLTAFAFNAKAQEYKPLVEFETDTIAYLQYNFIDRKDEYIGQPLRKLVADYEVLPFRLNPKETYPFAPEANGKSFIYGVVILYLYPSEMAEYKKTHKSYGVLSIDFIESHLEWNSIRKEMLDSDDDFELAEKLGSCVLKSLDLLIRP